MELTLFQYCYPFANTFTTSSASFSDREGLYLQLYHEGIRALGEAAPLPGFSVESLNKVRQFITSHPTEIKSYLAEQIKGSQNRWPALSPEPPAALAFALDTLIADYRSKKKNCSLQNLLFERSKTTLPVNATLPINSLEQSLDRTHQLWNEGYRTIKLKVGANFDHELALLHELRNSFPEIALRIDANQSWLLEEAITKLRAIEKLDIEYCEEPISNPTGSALRKIREATNIPIAIDESLYGQGDSSRWIANNVGDFLIIKPMILGSFQKIFETCSLATDHDYGVIFTSALESGIGRWMTAALAAGLGTRDMAHGLSTGHLLTIDVWKDHGHIKNGTLNLPNGPGLTVNLPVHKPDSGLTKLDLL